MPMPDIRRNLGPSRSQSTTYEAIGHAEDLSQIITRIDPEQNFFLDRLEKRKVVELAYEWLTESLRPPGVNAHREKEDYVSGPVGSLEGMGNNVQRFVTTGYVTDAQRKVKKAYSQQDEYVRLIQNALLEHANDIEYAIVNNDRKKMEDAAGPALTGGIPYFMRLQNQPAHTDVKTNMIRTDEPHGLRTGDFVYFTAKKMPSGLKANTLYYVRQADADPAHQFAVFDTAKEAVDNAVANQVKLVDDGVDFVIVKNNVVDLQGTSDFTLDDINKAMQMAYNRGGNPTTAVMCGSKKNRFSALAQGVMTINRSASGRDAGRELSYVTDVFETDFGTVTAQIHRRYPFKRIDLIDWNYWALAVFDPTHQVQGLPKKGSYTEFGIESTYGVFGTQPKASGSVINIAR